MKQNKLRLGVGIAVCLILCVWLNRVIRNPYWGLTITKWDLSLDHRLSRLGISEVSGDYAELPGPLVMDVTLPDNQRLHEEEIASIAVGPGKNGQDISFIYFYFPEMSLKAAHEKAVEVTRSLRLSDEGLEEWYRKAQTQMSPSSMFSNYHHWGSPFIGLQVRTSLGPITSWYVLVEVSWRPESN